MPEALALLALVAGVQERPATNKAVIMPARNKKDRSICAHDVPHKLTVPRPRYPLHGLIFIKYDDRIVREMAWPLAALGHPTISPSVVGGRAV